MCNRTKSNNYYDDFDAAVALINICVCVCVCVCVKMKIVRYFS